MTTTRRELLTATLQSGLAIAVAATLPGSVARAADAACYDPASLPLSQRTRRRSLGYTDASGDPARRCGLCAFFTGTSTGCGTCQILTGGTVSAAGVCSSFAPRPSK